MMNEWSGFGGWGMGFGFVLMLLFWILVILGIAVLIRWMLAQPSPSRSSRDKTPLEMAQKRYARGEIDREEYEQKKRGLEPRAQGHRNTLIATSPPVTTVSGGGDATLSGR